MEEGKEGEIEKVRREEGKEKKGKGSEEEDLAP